MASRQAPSRATATNLSQVRRNLFHSNLSRRPTSASTSTSATTSMDSPQGNTSDIVIRDQNGNYEVPVLSLPTEADGQSPEAEGKGEEKDKIEAKLLEMLRNSSRKVGEPAELLAAVHSNLQRKVASLEEDRWMFEAEPRTNG